MLDIPPELESKLVQSVAITAIVILLRFLMGRVVGRRTADPRRRYQLRKAASYISFAVVLLGVGRVWFQGVAAITTYLGLVSAGLAVALQEPIANLAGWALIVARRPFDVGDRIQIGDTVGDVIDVRIFQFSLMEVGNWVHAEQSTGRVIHVPNVRVFRDPLANYHRGFDYIWTETPVLVTFESDWKKAKQILQEVGDKLSGHLAKQAEKSAVRAAERYLIHTGKLTPIVYTKVAESGVLLTLRFLCEPRKRRNAEQDVWEEVLARFAEHDDIDYAYPTHRFYDNVSEGKAGARAAALVKGGGAE
jgi:small-conductance mechanosensitive channel